MCTHGTNTTKGPLYNKLKHILTYNLALDGRYGPATQAAAYKWQRAYGLKYDVSLAHKPGNHYAASVQAVEFRTQHTQVMQLTTLHLPQLARNRER